MSSVTYSGYSPYRNTPQTSWYLSNWNPIDVAPDISDSLIQLNAKYKNRPDLLAYDLYGTVQLWWVFMSRNPDILIDPIFDMTEGVLIYVPTVTRITSVLGV